jgi:hypothetical protein
MNSAIYREDIRRCALAIELGATHKRSHSKTEGKGCDKTQNATSQRLQRYALKTDQIAPLSIRK